MKFDFIRRSLPRARAFLVFLAIVVLVLMVYASIFRDPVGGLGTGRSSRATRTALALTSAALLGPFPTATEPTKTPSQVPTATITPSLTLTPTSTRTPTPRVFFTLTARTIVPRATSTNTPPPTRTRAPTRTRVPTRKPPTSYP